MSTIQSEKYALFKSMHEGPGAFVIPNPWNAGTARILTALGFAFSLGRRDGAAALTRDEVLANAKEIVDATHLPVSADLEDGYGSAPEACAETVRLATAAGLVGGSIEDATGDADNPIFEFNHAVERVAAACEAARALPFVLTARAENFLHGRPDLDGTIRRLQAFEKVGADVVYAPGLPSLEAIRALCESVVRPVNVVMCLKPPVFSVEELQEAGVRRISVGGAFARAALGAFVRAAQEEKENGTFTFSAEAITGAEEPVVAQAASGLLRPGQRPERLHVGAELIGAFGPVSAVHPRLAAFRGAADAAAQDRLVQC